MGLNTRWVWLLTAVLVLAAAAVAAKARPAGAPAQAGAKVTVKLTEWTVTLDPKTIRAGTITFQVANAGKYPHGLAIERTSAKTATLNPGQKATLTAKLKAGTYKVYCPVDNHRQMGMEAKLTVK